MTIGVIGCGLIGGSVGLACRANGHHVVAYEPDANSGKVALERGCANELKSIEEVAQAQVIFVCVPPGSALATLDQVVRVKPEEAVVTDCTSVKGSIVEWLEGVKDAKVVPGHPMAGHEKSGPQFASAWMFRGAKWILTPCPFTDTKAVQAVEQVVREMGATTVRLKADRHDRDVAMLSHLPHALAAVLVRMAAELESTEASAGSWKDLTRVGGVDPSLWTQILMSNRSEVGRVLDEFGQQLDELKSALAENDEVAVRKFLDQAKKEKERQK